ncbi:SDR family NAD(P)-dependent oxidoreductase [Peribacillus simplex]|uniref:SDR family NAD(P)-dependent oxidoreductase n=1 Tax=Peribacillus simplex TaxID=1478 RepID=UPI00192058FC|nr:SDR family NAD(P)-dependent oxidoreductase [Peribacillus simplex]MBD8591103.1 SDR family NAD(P)-dependent oxidoreductase [Peribacillus simplex]
MASGQRMAIVTGAGRGIGRAIALRLAQDGLNVVINDVNLDTAESVVNEIREFGPTADMMEDLVAAHPTLSEAIHEALLNVVGQAVHC